MKKLLFRAVSILCVIGAVCLTLFPAWFQLSGVKRKQLKALREDVDSFATSVSEAYSKDKSAYLDACEDIDLELSRKEIKQWVSRLKEVGNIAYAGKLSLMNVTKAGLLLADAVKLLEEPIEDNGTQGVLRILTGNGWVIIKEEAEKIDTAIKEGLGDYLRLPGTVMLILVSVLCALAVTASALTGFNKGGAARWILFALVLLLAGASIAGTTVLNGLDLELPEGYEKAKLTCTVWPYLSAVLSLAGAILPCFGKETDKEKAKRNLTKTLIIAGSVVLALGLAGMVVFVDLPFIRYQRAESLYKQEKYAEAQTAYTALDDYKDSKSKGTKCIYQQAKQAQEAGEYEQAIAIYESLEGYKDSQEQITACQTALKDIAYEEAIALKDAGKYEEAIEAFKKLNGYKESNENIKTCECETAYKKALILIGECKFAEAMAVFESLKDFKDSETQLLESKYQYSLLLMDEGKFDDAIRILIQLQTCGYADSEAQITECQYREAVSLFSVNKYDEAIGAFLRLKDYKDSEELVLECKYQKAKAYCVKDDYISACTIYWTLIGYKDVDDILKCDEKILEASKTIWKKGNTVFFGHYGGEDIEWLVLEQQGDRVMVISKHVLDAKPFNTKSYYDETEPGTRTWIDCTLRDWMNGEFIETAFTAPEQTRIDTTYVLSKGTKDSKGNIYTGDKAFLLSTGEVYRYFSSNKARLCTPTDYAKSRSYFYCDSAIDANGKEIICIVDGKKACDWWTRTSSTIPPIDMTALVTIDGQNEVFTGYDAVLGVRPAMWLNIG